MDGTVTGRAALAVVVACAGTSVFAQDAVDWSGSYVGGHLGFGQFGTNVEDLDGDMFDDPGMELNTFGDSFTYGAQFGHNWQDGRFVFGVEADIQGGNYSERTFMDGDDHRAGGGLNWFSTLRARAGVSSDSTLMFLTGGLAYTDAFYCGADGECVIDGDEDLAFDEGRLGFTVGAGMETRLTDRMSFKAEYLYIDGDRFEVQYDDSDPDQRAAFDMNAHVFRVGLNYHLGTLARPASTAPQYSFAGGYAGVSGGFGGFGNGVIDLDGDMFDGSGADEAEMNLFGNGVLFGVQAGYNWEMGDTVWGVEADFAGTSYDEFSITDGLDHVAEGSWNWLSTLRGRAGRKYGNSFLYGTAGLAAFNADYCGTDDACVSDDDDQLAFTETRYGYTIGAGVETKLSNALSLKGEYLYVDGGDFDKVYDSGSDERANFRTSAHVFRFGLNRSF